MKYPPLTITAGANIVRTRSKTASNKRHKNILLAELSLIQAVDTCQAGEITLEKIGSLIERRSDVGTVSKNTVSSQKQEKGVHMQQTLMLTSMWDRMQDITQKTFEVAKGSQGNYCKAKWRQI